MKKLEVKIFENFRTHSEDGVVSFKTDLPCRCCLKVSPNYILLEGWIRICKGCLSDWIKNLEDNYTNEYILKAGRKEESE